MTAASDPGRGFRERHYTSQDGLRLYFRDYGDPSSTATPVLCLSGLTRNSRDFHGVALRLSAARRVLCPDYRGRGRSQYDRDWRRYAPRTYLDDIRHLLAAVNLHRVVVIGTSLGGILAAAMAVAMPCAVAGAVLNDVGPEIGRDGLERIIAYMRDDRPQADWSRAARHLREVFPDLPADDEDGWLEIARGTYRECGDGLLRIDWDPAIVKPLLRRRDRSPDLWPLFRALGRIPAVVLRGATSNILGEATVKRMTGEIPGLTAVTVGGVGHAPSLAEPEAAEAIDGILERT